VFDLNFYTQTIWFAKELYIYKDKCAKLTKNMKLYVRNNCVRYLIIVKIHRTILNVAFQQSLSQKLYPEYGNLLYVVRLRMMMTKQLFKLSTV